MAVAIALVKKRVFMREFFDDYGDLRVIKLGQKAEVYTDAEIDAAFPKKIGTRLEIMTRNKHYTAFEDDKQPVPYSFIKEKFIALASPQLSNEKIKNIINAIDRLEKIDNIREVSCLLD